MKNRGIEKTLVLLKPDAVKRGVVGEILHRFERAGLKIVGMKMVYPTVKLGREHYLTSDEDVKVYGERTIADCQKFGLSVKEMLGTEDPIKIGKLVWKWNFDFLTSGPVLAIVLEGLHAVENCKMLSGSTIPLSAMPGTIRGDFALDSAIGADLRKRAIYNLVHASGNVKEAEREIKLWFKPSELVKYRRVHEDLYDY